MHHDDLSERLTRRQALGVGAAGAALLAGWGIGRPDRAAAAPADIVLRPRRDTVELGRRTVRTWTYDGRLPGCELRLRQGEPVRIRVENQLPAPTSNPLARRAAGQPRRRRPGHDP